MKEIFTNVIYLVITVAILRFIAGVVLPRFENVLIRFVKFLVKFAEKKIKGSKLGEKKKAFVLRILKICGVKTTEGISALIDTIVYVMNNKSDSIIGDFKSDVSTKVEGTIDSTIGKVTNKQDINEVDSTEFEEGGL